MSSPPDAGAAGGDGDGAAADGRLRFASLGSGSGGNGTLVAYGDCLVLIDCGFGLKDAWARLARLGVAPEQLTAIFVTHEHTDHASGVTALAHRFRKPVHLSHGTLRALPKLDTALARPFLSGAEFALGTARVQAVTVPHDAREPTQFVFRLEGAQLGVLTDAGTITPHMRECFQRCTALLLESNHDRAMLFNGDYPLRLKRRIASDHGHLSNEQAAEFLDELTRHGLRQAVIGHISQQNNSAERLAAVFEPFRAHLRELRFAEQDAGTGWMAVPAATASRAVSS